MINQNIKFIDIINESKHYRTSEYINFFFSNIASIKKEVPIYDDYSGGVNAKISIIKDSTSRILDKNRGKLMERTWRNCIFYFIDKNTYKNYFGSNNTYPNIVINNNSFSYDGTFEKSNSKYPNDPKVTWQIIKGFQDSVFEYFKTNHSSWFIRSYVYFILVIIDNDSIIRERDFHLYYWNTNYSFSKITNKKNIFYNVLDSYFVENVSEEIQLIETGNRDVIDCVKAYTGELDFRNQTEENYVDISNDINSGINFILVQGAARTGKTIIAMRLLGYYKDSKFLIMNYYFYIALKDAFKILGVKFPLDRIFHHNLQHRNNGCWIKNLSTKKIIPKLDFLIVDEAQRLSFVKEYINNRQGYSLPPIDEFDVIINSPDQKHTIFLGDDLQKINPKYDEGFGRIYNKIQNKNFREYYFKNTIGVPPEILENVKFILNVGNGGQVQPTNNFIINVTNDINTFISNFENDNIIKKHYVYVALDQLGIQLIENNGKKIYMYPKELKDADYPYLFNEEIKSKFMLSTYEVISREIESVYLYLPSDITYSKDEDVIKINGYNDTKINEFLLNHIYTLMTRATWKLSIMCEDENFYNYLSKKIQKINELNLELKELISKQEEDESIEDVYKEDNEMIYDYDFFIAYHGTINPNGSYEKAIELCDILKNNGYTVFLNNYSATYNDRDLGFNETRNVIQRCKNFVLVFNDNIYRDRFDMIPRKYEDGKPNQLYLELTMFSNLVDEDLRTNKHNLKFFYTGTIYNRQNIYNFLNKLYRIGTAGNSNCCFFTHDELLDFAKQ